MCTQEILWCACGHGEFLPILKCPQAETVGFCFTVVHGDHRVVLPMKCSYCVSGQAERAALSTNARPEGELATLIEGERGTGRVGEGGDGGVVVVNDGDGDGEGVDDGAVANNVDGEGILGVEDGAETEWEGFGLDPELWQYG